LRERGSSKILENIGYFLYRFRGIIGAPLFLVAFLYEDITKLSIVLSLPFLILGETLRIWSVAYAGPKTRARVLIADRLITDGPYSYLRNPIYLGNFFIGFALVLLSNALFPYLLVFYSLGFFIEYYLIVRAEEVFLEEKFGEEYVQYKTEVMRFIPRLKRFNRSKEVKPDLMAALRAERSTFLLIVSLLLIFMVKHFSFQ